MNDDRVRVVLDDRVTEDDLTALAGEHGWWNVSRIGRCGDQPEAYVYATRDGATRLHYIEDHKIGVSYVLVAGSATREVAGVLVDNLYHYDPADIREGARNDMSAEDRRSSLYFLALVTMDHGFDPEVAEIFQRALTHPDPVVRGAAVLGSAYLGWPELAAPIRTLAESDEPDDTIRKDAALLSERLAKAISARRDPTGNGPRRTTADDQQAQEPIGTGRNGGGDHQPGERWWSPH